jgi:phenylpropionate dioxygenase-like ring-hydroxylating dioxygenase large terminal subunit
VDKALVERLKQDMADEFARTAPPPGFPAFHDIPAGRYIDERFFALERTHLWPFVWVMAGRAEDIPAPGDYFTFDDLGVPIVVVRGRDMQARAYYNTCQHRGAPVVRDRRGSARSLRCGYHGWTYDIDDGRLVSVPDERDFVSLCRDERGLNAISCEVWENWIFVNQDPEAASLRQWFGDTLDQMEELSGSELRALSLDSQTIACNWKVTAEAFLEVYHFRFIHSRGAGGGDTLLDGRGAVMGLLPNGCSRMITPYSKSRATASGMSDWSDWQHLVTPGFADIPAVNDMIRCTSSAFGLFPNLITPVSGDGFPFIFFWPIDQRTTRLDWIFYAPKDWEGDELPSRWRARIDAFNLIMEEDRQNMAPMQRSLDSPAFTGVPINYQERRIWHFHEQIDRTIGIDRIPEELRVAQLLAPYVEGSMATTGADR